MTTIDIEARTDIADLYGQIADLQERLKAWEELVPIIAEALQGLANDNVTLQSKLTVRQLKQLSNIHNTYGIGQLGETG